MPVVPLTLVLTVTLVEEFAGMLSGEAKVNMALLSARLTKLLVKRVPERSKAARPLRAESVETPVRVTVIPLIVTGAEPEVKFNFKAGLYALPEACVPAAGVSEARLTENDPETGGGFDPPVQPESRVTAPWSPMAKSAALAGTTLAKVKP